MLCPYAECDKVIVSPAKEGQPGVCACEWRQPIARCVECGMGNRAGAVFCRRCREMMQAGAFHPSAAQSSTADFLTIRGSFKRPPLVAGGFLYALSASGALFQLSPRRNAKAIQAGNVGESSAAYNRSALVNVPGGRSAGGRGWTFLTASPSAVLAMPLVTGTVSTLYEPRGGEEIAANRSEADCTGFRGVAANSDVCAFIAMISAGEFLLTLKLLSDDRAVSQPVGVHGSRVAGPALHDGTLMVCSDQETAVYHLASQTDAKMPLPHGFDPLLRPSVPELSVSPGSIPMTAWKASNGRLLGHVAGVQHGVAGLLEIDFSCKTTAFRPLPSGSSIFTNADGSLSLNLLDQIERIGAKCEIVRTARLHPGMPASVGDEFRCWFREEDHPGKHRVSVSVESRVIELFLDDAGCTANTCFGVYGVDGELLVAFTDPGAEGTDAAMRLAHWTLL